MIFMLGFGGTNNRQSSVSIGNLRCEYLTAPLGIDMDQPRLSWELTSKERNKKQSAYQILVSADSLSLLQDKADLWNSGEIKSDQTNQVVYNGNTLHSRQYCYWKVRIWDENGVKSNWSPITSWSIGLLNKKDWQAKWIGDDPQQIPKEQQYYINHGYLSGIAPSADANEWIIADLGKNQDIKEVRLYPVHPLKKTTRGRLVKDSTENAKGYLFPLRFSLDVSDDENFHTFKTIANESGQDYNSAGHTPYVTHSENMKGRYVRVRVSKLSKIDSIQYAFALAELEVVGNSNKNLALHAPVKVSKAFPGLQPIPHEDWSAKVLVDGFLEANENKPNSIPIPPSPLLRKEFEIIKNVKKAFLYVSALGLYETRINGKKVGNHILAPEWTDYHTRAQYEVYDATNLLRKGKNAIGAMLADGWYAGSIFSHLERGGYGFDRRLLGQLEINYIDGTKGLVKTDESWKISDNGPIRQASIFDGELYDAGFVQKGWDQPGFDDIKWKKVAVDTSVSIKLNSQMNEPVKIINELKPVGVFKKGNATYIFDMGQNMVGWVKLSIPYNPGGKIIFRYGEVLNDDSTLYNLNLRSAKQTDIYIPSEEQKIEHEPRFTYHGFRYVEISGLVRPPSLNNITGKVIASSSKNVGSLETSHAGLNKLWQNILWTQRGNMQSIFSDCPQRDERAGWMGDAQVFSQTAIFNLDMAGFYTKWIRDIRDSQADDGRFSDWAPDVGVWLNQYNSPGWADAGVIVPWKTYQNYGDINVLSNQYEAMKKFNSHILKYNPDLIWRQSRGSMYGDWLNGDNIKDVNYPRQGGRVSNDIYSTAFFAYSTRIIAKTAKLLQKDEDARYYDSLATAIQAAFVKEFISDDGRITGNTQAGYALALEFNLVPEQLKTKAASYMVEAIKTYDYRPSTGIQSTIRLMNQLTCFGYDDIAFKLLESRRLPSWLYSVDHGATTIWERWDGYVKGRGIQGPGMNSFNHVAFGAVGEWMYRNILGINYDEEHPGYHHFILKPEPGGTLTWAKGSYHSIAGTIAVSWKKDKENFNLDIVIPVNTTASVFLPRGKKFTESDNDIRKSPGIKIIAQNEKGLKLLVASGRYTFKVFK